MTCKYWVQMSGSGPTLCHRVVTYGTFWGHDTLTIMAFSDRETAEQVAAELSARGCRD